MKATRFISAPHARNNVSVHDFVWIVYIKRDCSPIKIKNSLLCNKFHCFHNVQTLVLVFSFSSQHAIDWSMDSLFWSF